MDKSSFIRLLSEALKGHGFRKKGQYWYKTEEQWICCVNVQGSQWSKEDCYVNIGAAKNHDSHDTPTILHWNWVHRCTDSAGREVNVNVSDVINCALPLFREFCREEQKSSFYQRHNSVEINGRMFF